MYRDHYDALRVFGAGEVDQRIQALEEKLLEKDSIIGSLVHNGKTKDQEIGELKNAVGVLLDQVKRNDEALLDVMKTLKKLQAGAEKV